MRKFLERDENVRVGHPLRGQMTMRIEACRNRHIVADHLTDATDNVPFRIIVANRDHSAVEAENDPIDGKCVSELSENFVANCLECLSVDHTAGRCPTDGSLEKLEAFFF